jgi:hypothetical protein
MPSSAIMKSVKSDPVIVRDRQFSRKVVMAAQTERNRTVANDLRRRAPFERKEEYEEYGRQKCHGHEH